jgi:hypothetical protein
LNFFRFFTALILQVGSTHSRLQSLAMDHHTLAAISIGGTCLDVLGSLYLAYDLLGGQHGPLRLLTRAVTYSVVFGVGYGLGLGLVFGLAAGISSGITIAIELNRTSRGLPHFSLPWEAFFASVRSAAFGLALYRVVGGGSSALGFAVTFAVLTAAGATFFYSRGMRPGMAYPASGDLPRPRLTRRQFWSTVARTFGYIVAALICSAFFGKGGEGLQLALRIGLVTGLTTGVGQTVIPFIEFYADHLPERRMGAYGIGLILCGFALQSVQYWLQLFDVKVT